MSQKDNVRFTKSQFKALLVLSTIGEWVANATRGEKGGPKVLKKYEDLLFYLNKHAKQFGLEKYLDPDPDKNGRIFTNRDFDVELTMPLIEQYEDEIFWDELPMRLADRDLDLKYHGKEITQDERYHLLCEIEDRYNREFETRGLLNVFVDLPSETKKHYFAIFTTLGNKKPKPKQVEKIRKVIQITAIENQCDLKKINYGGSYWFQISIGIPDNYDASRIFDIILAVGSSHLKLLNYHVLVGEHREFTTEEIDKYRDGVKADTKSPPKRLGNEV